ncbi:tetratricopeptide repeat protein [Danxiaibacter flavus]|uniref:Tetratricopeptide repeat protein n=1 Tax=Danxiaibacter flavus TaxID=3049108 RepID=A0ABV3ZPY2_9BACT|nr:tetratricopeptide repeat protein [Chitinophagaceae bacterium DXS]
MEDLQKILRFFLLSFILLSCKGNHSSPTKETISQLNLKRGNVISCGQSDGQFGTVDFDMTCNASTKKDFNLAIELLHSFEYDEAEKVFAKVIDQSPDCAMAYWGVAMSNFHPLWNPPTEAELQKGAKAIAIANSIRAKSDRESGYINAIGLFYKDWDKKDHQTRCVDFEKAMEQLHRKYPDDNEAAIFYALALDASASPTDKTYANQKKAGDILNALYPKEFEHPGIIHYIIHTYDYPGLASVALPAARRYAQVAPSSAHALHMPSHIFTRLGFWDEDIHSNLQSVAAAQCYAKQAGISGHWDEELHGLDYVVYAYLQKGNNKLAQEQVKYVSSIKSVYPVNFKIAYAFAAIPARYVLENKDWKGAAALQLPQANFSWSVFPWQEAIVHFARLLGAAHTGDFNVADTELAKLNQLKDTLNKLKDSYKEKEVAIQIKAGEAWLQFERGNQENALNQMQLAAAMEDSIEKHPVTPGEVLPARELQGDMLMEAKQYKNALAAYEAVLVKSPNRFNSLYSAGIAAEKLGDKQKAVSNFKQLLTIADTANSNRPEIGIARSFFKKD